MKTIFEVRRKRYTVTQGEVAILLNGQEVITFGDKIELIREQPRNETEYDEVIGGWQSVKSNSDFIYGVLFPSWANGDIIQNRIKEILAATTTTE